MQNVIPLNEGEMDLAQDPETQLQEQEKRIEISCALATEASRRGRMLSGKMKCSAALSEDQATGHHSPNKSKAFASIDELGQILLLQHLSVVILDIIAK